MRTTKTITLVLISSALAFIGWGCPLAHDEPKAGPAARLNHHFGYSGFWYHRYGYGYGGWAGSSSPGGTSTGRSGTLSSRGGFGTSGGPAVS